MRLKISLKLKITIMVVLLIVAIMASVTYFFTIRELTSRKREVEVRMERIAQNIASIRSLEEIDWEAYQNYIDDLLTFNQDIVYIAIFDEKGALKAHVLNVNWVEIPAYQALDRAIEASIVRQLDQGLVTEESKSDFETVPVNIQVGNRNLGTVKVGFSLIQINQQLRSDLLRNLELSGLFLVMGVLASIFLSARVTRPLAKLSAAMMNISKGNLNQEVKIRSRDEIGDLATTFNRMTKGLKEKEIVESFSRDLGFTFEVDKISRLIVERIANALDCRKGWLLLRDSSSSGCTFRGYPRSDKKGSVITLDQSVEDYFRSVPKALFVADIQKKSKLSPTIARLKENFGNRDVALLAPLVSKGELLGILALSFKSDGGSFSVEEAKFVDVLARHAALAVENAFLYEDLTEQERLKRELEIARQVQQKLLPQSNPQVSGLDIDGICVPAKEVGGDYYDYFFLGNRKLGVVIADVTGKGTSASFYMAEIKGMMLTLSEIYSSPKELLSNLNRRLYRHVDRRVFATMVYGVFDLNARELRFARAGHNSVLLKRRDQVEAEVLTPQGIGLGLEKGDIFDQVILEDRISLNSGDIVLFYTDGITEAMNSSKEEFGEHRLMKIIEMDRPPNCCDLRRKIFAEVEAFGAGEPQHDDMTLVAVRVC